MLCTFNFVEMITSTTPPHPASPCLVCTESMDVDLERIIQCIKQGDDSGVQAQLQGFNKEVIENLQHLQFCLFKPFFFNHLMCACVFASPVLLISQFAQCFFFDAEERERRKVSPRPAIPLIGTPFTYCTSRKTCLRFPAKTPPAPRAPCSSLHPPPPPALHCLVCD